MGRYELLWNLIRKKDEPITVRCPKRVQERLIRAIQQQKSKVNVQRKSLDLPSYGRLVAIREDGIVIFSLSYNGENF